MSEFALQKLSDGCYGLKGELVFRNVATVRERSLVMFHGAEDSLEVDLQDITRADSAGLVLLIDWMRAAARLNKHIVFNNIPPQMMDIAKVSGLDAILPLAQHS